MAGEWVPAVVAAVGVIGTVVGAMAWQTKQVTKVLVDQINSRTDEHKEDRALYEKSMSEVSIALKDQATATVSLAGLIQEERKITSRRHKETCALLKEIIPDEVKNGRNGH